MPAHFPFGLNQPNGKKLRHFNKLARVLIEKVDQLFRDTRQVEGPFIWHSHPDTDDFFLVLDGELDIEMRDRTVTLSTGQIFVVPKGVEHRPVARRETHLLLIEPTGTPNTGDVATAAARKTI